MEKTQGLLLIVAACGMVLLILAMRKHSYRLLNLVYRGASGALGIYLINYLLQYLGYPCSVGLNPATVLTSAILGFPGVILLFGIRIYGLL